MLEDDLKKLYEKKAKEKQMESLQGIDFKFLKPEVKAELLKQGLNAFGNKPGTPAATPSPAAPKKRKDDDKRLFYH